MTRPPRPPRPPRSNSARPTTARREPATYTAAGRYLYERLGDQRFQQLCSALLAHVFPGATCFPVGQADGGRDGRRRVRPVSGTTSQLIYQVKSTTREVRNPVTWLDAAVKTERDNITRLVCDGASGYYLLTNVAGTGMRDRGTMDRLDERLQHHSRHFGIPIDCWWRADIDARVDAAPREITWAYAEMLAGHDAIRYLLHAERGEGRAAELRELVLKVVATQWQEDAKVKFTEVELDSYELADLFVDVEAHRRASPRAAPQSGLALRPRGGARGEAGEPEALGGAAAYLLAAAQPLTLVRGEPGQGKSTLGQYICQVHRAEFLHPQDHVGSAPERGTTSTRLPLRVDLRDYARWLDGGDPFGDPDADEQPTRRPRRRPVPSTVEAFLAVLLTARSGGRTAGVPDVQDILARFPALVVLDGLDEVARDDARARVVREIDQFVARLATDTAAHPQVVVTTRPNASGLPEPTPDSFETIALARLGPALRTSYLRKWADVRGIQGRARRELQRTFDQRSSEPHIAQLADNPMQLTILLYLMQRRGVSVPTARTELYTSYMQTFLDREAGKTAAVQRHRADLEEVTAFLGWHLQNHAETARDTGRMTTAAIKSAINTYLYETGKDTLLVEDLFTAVTDRVWALTSKISGTFEFDVQPVREYFAAAYLYRFARTTTAELPRSQLLRELISRPYWLNTARFYAGFANPNEIAGLVEGLEDALDAPARYARQIRTAAWTLLGDGVFAARPRTQQRVTELLIDDLSTRLINDALDRGEIQPLPPDRGALPLVESLTRRVQDHPDATLSPDRAQLAARHDPDGVRHWCQTHLQTAAGTPSEPAWLRLAAAVAAGHTLPTAVTAALHLDHPDSPTAALAAGIDPEPGSQVEQTMIRAVLDGRCSDTVPAGSGTAADLLRLLAPQHLLRLTAGDEPVYAPAVQHQDTPLTGTQRRTAVRHLTPTDPPYARIADATRFRRGQTDTTSPWGNTARELAQLHGRCWLAADIAVIGAASPQRYRSGGDITTSSDVLGPTVDYGRLLQEVRRHRSTPTWWTDAFDDHPDPLSRATWALALLAVAAPAVLTDCLPLLDNVVTTLPPADRDALAASSSRIGAWRHGRRLPSTVLAGIGSLSPLTALLLTHHVADHARLDPLPELAESLLAPMAEHGPAGWPAHRAITARLASGQTPQIVHALLSCGPGAAIETSDVNSGMPLPLAENILASPARYPLGWLLAADTQSTQRHPQEPITETARRHGWFDS